MMSKTFLYFILSIIVARINYANLLDKIHTSASHMPSTVQEKSVVIVFDLPQHET